MGIHNMKRIDGDRIKFMHAKWAQSGNVKKRRRGNGGNGMTRENGRSSDGISDGV